jgi:hypothetical protein
MSRIILYIQSFLSFSVENLVQIAKQVLNEKGADLSDVRYDIKLILTHSMNNIIGHSKTKCCEK